MPTMLNIADAARRLGVPPRVLSDGFYAGTLTDKHCERISGRRVIREDQLSAIATELRKAGKLTK